MQASLLACDGAHATAVHSLTFSLCLFMRNFVTARSGVDVCVGSAAVLKPAADETKSL